MFESRRSWTMRIALVAGLVFFGPTQAFTQSQPPQQFDPAEKRKQTTKEKNGAPIDIKEFGNKLVVTSDEPATLARVSELLRLLTATKADGVDFEFIRLKYANAVDIARILDEAFNGPKRAVAFPDGDGKGHGDGGMQTILAAIAAAAREDRIRVVADAATNALLVRANPQDMLTIRDLLSKQLDTGHRRSDPIVKTFIIGPLKHANASEVAAILRDIYRESMDNTTRRHGQMSNPFAQAAPRANGSPESASLLLGVDDKTNILIVACSLLMCEEIRKLVDQIEVAVADTKEAAKLDQVRVYTIRNINAVEVGQTLEQLLNGRPIIDVQRGKTPPTHQVARFRVAALPSSNIIIVRGDPYSLDAIEAIIAKLEAALNQARRDKQEKPTPASK